MTLIVTAIFPRFIVQACDRLVTLKPDFREGDSWSNKTIVFRGTDGVLVMSYTGNAFVQNIPTDEWIAGVLWGAAPERGHDNRRPALMQLGGGRRCRVTYSLHLLVESLSALNLPIEHHIEIQGAGYWIRRKRIIPYWFRIGKLAGHREVLFKSSPRQPITAGVRIGSAGMDADRSELWRRIDEFAVSHPERRSVRDIENLIAAFIRDCADKKPGIGKNVLTVVLSPQGGGSRFHGIDSHPVTIVGKGGAIDIPDTVHTPWLVSPGLLRSPSIEGGPGGWNISLAGYPFEIKGGAPLNDHFLSLSSSVDRPTPREMGRFERPSTRRPMRFPFLPPLEPTE